MPVSKRLRYEVQRRDGYMCRYCGARAPEAQLTIDHVVPVTLGGPDDATNLVTACVDCNAGKSSIPPDAPLVAGVADDALRWAKAKRAAAAVMAEHRDELDRAVWAFDDEWIRHGAAWRPDDWGASVEQWITAGLPADVLRGFVAKTMGSRRDGYWRYLCGCAWGAIRELHDRAHQLIAEGVV